jgi:spore germination cell wall hydrolase CwlJ-like protein
MKRDTKYNLAMLLMIFGLIFATCQNAEASDESEDIYCLAKNIYFEAGNQPLAGRMAVAYVTINRMNHGLFPDNICDVVYQGGETKYRCQFSWYCDGKHDIPTDSETWLSSLVLANKLLNSYSLDITEGSLWYHANYIEDPYWSKELTPTVIINNHIFYK